MFGSEAALLARAPDGIVTEDVCPSAELAVLFEGVAGPRGRAICPSSEYEACGGQNQEGGKFHWFMPLNLSSSWPVHADPGPVPVLQIGQCSAVSEAIPNHFPD